MKSLAGVKLVLSRCPRTAGWMLVIARSNGPMWAASFRKSELAAILSKMLDLAGEISSTS